MAQRGIADERRHKRRGPKTLRLLRRLNTDFKEMNNVKGNIYKLPIF